MFINDLNPVFIDISFLEIRWYSLAYIFGLISSQKIFNQIKNSKFLKNLLASFALAFAIIFINRQTSFIYFQF